MLLKSTYFWVITLVFLVIVGVISWKFLPPMIATMNSTKTELGAFKDQIVTEREYADNLKKIASDDKKINELYNLAQTALPITGEGEQLLIQLDGLLASLSLSSSVVTVPYAVDKTAAGDKAAPANELTVTVNGNISYLDFKKLLTGLKTFIRFNKISSFAIVKSGDTYASTITMKVFSRPAPTVDFTGQSDFLSKATAFFAAYQSYAVRPNTASEGSYGRDDPFSPTN